MLFPKRLTISRSRTARGASQSSKSRRRNRRDFHSMPRTVCCGPAVEELEARTLLSAVSSTVAGTAAPKYIIDPNVTPQASPGSSGYTPIQIQQAYTLSTGTAFNNNISFNGAPANGIGETIAIVDAYNDPNIVSDVGAFSTEFGLPQLNSGGPTFQVLNETGGTTPPSNSEPFGWDVEESLDVEWVHSMAPEANIILYEANSDSFQDMLTTEQTAADNPNVSVVSNSWGGGEFSGETQYDSIFTTPASHLGGITFLAATGDQGSPSGYPALSPNVVAVGGTSLTLQSDGAWGSETVWNDLSIGEGATAGGPSQYELLPGYQDKIDGINDASTTFRNNPDVAADADPVTGVWVYDSYSFGVANPWMVVGGTSLACPLWAGIVGIANQGRAAAGEPTLNGITQTLPTLYTLPGSDFHEITTGTNGTYSAGPGFYNLCSGLGTPIADLIIPGLVGAATAPGITAPSTQSVAENGTLQFSTADGNAISISDPSATGNDSLSLSVGHGTLTLASVSGLSFTSGENGSASMIVTGTVSNLNLALNGMTYQPTPGFTGSDSLAITVTDPVDGQSASTTVGITVQSFAPAISVPPPQIVLENGTLQFTPQDGNAISISDPSATGPDLLTLQVGFGILELGSTSGLSFVGGADNSPLMTVSGTVANLNNALNGLIYDPTIGFAGSDRLALTVVDPGDALQGLATVPITVSAFPAPVINAPAAASLTENGNLVFSSANNNLVSVVDQAAGSTGDDSVTFALSHGTLTLSTTANLTFTSGANGTSSFTVDGNVGSIDAALEGMTYTPTADYYGSDVLSVSVFDPISNLSNSGSVDLTIAPVAPSVTGPPSVIVDANTSLIFSPQNNNAISITDPNSGPDSLALSVEHGTLSLASVSGLTFTSGNDNTAGFVVSGTLGALTNAIDGLSYTPTTNFTGTDVLSVSITNEVDGKSSSTSVTLLVDPVPAVSGPKTANVTENTAFTFSSANGNEISVTDIGAGTNSDVMTLSVSAGNLTLGSTTGLTFTNGTNDSNSFTVKGTIGNLNASLNGLTYQPDFTYVGSDTLSIQLTDPADTLSGSNSVAITISAISPPAISGPSSASVTENSTLVFPSANASAITIADNGAGNNPDQETLSVSNGTLTLATTNGLTFLGGANGSASFTVKSTVSNFNTALDGLTYTPTTGFAGSDSLSITVVDSGDSKSGSDTIALTVIALPPAITAPRSATLNENGTLPFSPADGNGISVSDANPATDSLALSVSHGTLTLSTTSGLTFTVGSNGSASFTVKGSVSSLNAALNGITYQPTNLYTGSDALGMLLTDLGNGKTASTSVALTIVGLAPPTVNAPATGSLVENGSLVFSTAGNNAIVVADAGAGSGNDSLTLTASHGTLTLATTNGVSITSGSNGSGSLTVSGTITNLNAALNGLTYKTTGYTGSDSVSISISDPGDSQSASTSVALTITAYAAPTITAPSGVVVNENGTIIFSTTTNNAIAVADSGPGSSADSLTLTVTHGTLTLATTSGVTITSGANGSASMTVVGSVANLNAALNGLTYQPTSGYTGSDNLAVSIKDTTDSLSASANVTLTVSTETGPAITAPGTVVTTTGTVVFTAPGTDAITIADPGAGSNVEELLIRASSGTVTLDTTSGITFVSGANKSSQMIIEGTLANLDAALNGLTYVLSGKSGTLVFQYTDLVTGLQASATITVTEKSATGTGPAAVVSGSGSDTSPDDSESSVSPDELTQYQGVTAAVEVLNG